MSDPVLDALNAAAQGGSPPSPGQAMSAVRGGTADPVLAALNQRAAQPDAAVSPQTPPRSVLQQTGDFLSAGIHHAANLPWAAGQLVSNVVAAPFRHWPDNPVSHAVIGFADDNNRIVSDRENTYQASTPNSTGAYMGATVGSVAPMLTGGIGGGLQKAGDAVATRVAPMLPKWLAPVGAKVVSGATQGGIMGAVQPVTQKALTLADLIAPPEAQPSFWEQKADQVGYGAAFGAAVPAVTAPVAAAWGAGKRAVANSAILNPSNYAGRQVGIQLGADAPTVASDLVNAPTYVPGSGPTSAQAGAHPMLVQIEKALGNQSPAFKGQMLARENSNNAARLQAVGNVAQTPEALQAAIDARDAATKPMRDFTVTNGNPVPVAPVKGAIASVANGTQGVSDTIGPAATSMGKKLDSFTTDTAPDTLMNVPGASTASPAMLDALRQNVNSYLAKNAPNGFVGTQEQAAMMPVKGAIIDAIDAANPGYKLSKGGWGKGIEQPGPEAPSYRDYLASFAKQSVPVNTMEVGQALQGTLQNKALNSAGDPAATFTNYQSALARALKQSDYPIDPRAQAALEAVQSDLQRSTISNSVRTGSGSDTAYNNGAGSTFLKAVGAGDDSNGKAAAAAAATLALTGSARTAGAAAFGAKKAGGFVTNRVAGALSDLMMDPQALAQALMRGSPALSATAPSAFGQLAGRAVPALNAALVAQLLQGQAPQVVGPNGQKAQAYQP